MSTKKVILFFAAIFAVFVVLAATNAAPASGASAKDLQKQINEKKASLSAGANKRKELENKIAGLKNQQADAARDKRNYDELIALIEAEVKETEDLVAIIEELIEQTELDIAQAEEDYEKSYEVFLNVLKYACEEGEVNYLALLLKSENFTDFLSRIDVISAIFEYNKNVIDSLVNYKADLEDKKGYLEEMITQQNDYKQQLSEQSRQVVKLRDEAIAAIKKIAEDIKKNEAAQKQFDDESASLLAEINRASKELAALQASERRYVGGNFKYPVTPKYNPPVSSGFGWRKSPITGRSEHHDGIDIPANYKAPIWAANDGIVITAKYSGGYGNYVVIDHGGGRSTLYAHASSLNVKVGDKVAKGDVIAYVGSTGWSTGNHLHFGYIENGVFKNPLASGYL